MMKETAPWAILGEADKAIEAVKKYLPQDIIEKIGKNN